MSPASIPPCLPRLKVVTLQDFSSLTFSVLLTFNLLGKTYVSMGVLVASCALSGHDDTLITSLFESAWKQYAFAERWWLAPVGKKL